MSFRSAFLAATAIFATAHGHMIMKSPTTYSVDKLDNSPITKAQYPCKSQNGFTFSNTTTWEAGSKQTVVLGGSAIHGGGGCQLSFAKGTSPTADTQFKAIATFQGCPSSTTNNEHTMDFTVPSDLPNGDMTLAWTWNSRLAGQLELYMNCAPITITGGKDDDSGLDALPDTLIANINDDCSQVANTNIEYPNPGDQLIVESSEFLSAPKGCAAGAGNGGTPASSAAGGSPSSPATSAPAAASSAVASNPGGVFAPGASSAVSSGAGAPQSTLTTMVTVTAAPSAPVQATSAPVASAPAAGTGTPATPSSPASGTACSENGAIVCNGSTQFGLCNNGNLVWQDVAAGTTCSNGVISKRSPYKLKGRMARPRLVVPGQDWTPEE